MLPDLRAHFEAYSTVSFDNYPVRELPEEPLALVWKPMNIRGVFIEDTFAEAFTMRVARIIITAPQPPLGPGSRAQADRLRHLGDRLQVSRRGSSGSSPTEETPDGRPGVSVLLMTMGKDDLPKRLIERVGQTVLTCPTTACYDGLPDAPDRVGVGSALRFFGDGFQASKMIGGQRFWRIPVMEGEFLVQEKFGMVKGVGGGNFLILARSADAALGGGRGRRPTRWRRGRASSFPFPAAWCGAAARSASRRIKTMIASTNDAFCPTLRAVTASALPEGVNSVLEIVINGVDAEAIARAMRAGIDAACREGVVAITAGNYGGKLGPHHFHLRKIMSGAASERRSRRHPQGAAPRPRRLRRGARGPLGRALGERAVRRPVVPRSAMASARARRSLRAATDTPSGRIRFEGDLVRSTAWAPGSSEGEVVVDGERGSGTRPGSGMSGGVLDIARRRRRPGRRLPRPRRQARDDRRRADRARERRARGRAPRMRRGLLVVLRPPAAATRAGDDRRNRRGVRHRRDRCRDSGPSAAPSSPSAASTSPPTYSLRLHLSSRTTCGSLLTRFATATGCRCSRAISTASIAATAATWPSLGKGEILAWTAQ